MEMHPHRSFHEAGGISAPVWRRSQPGRIARRAINRFLAILKTVKTAIEAEWAARHAIEELAGMNDHMLRDLGITRGEIESTVRRSRATIGTEREPSPLNDGSQGSPALPTISSPDLTSEGRSERQLQRLPSW